MRVRVLKFPHGAHQLDIGSPVVRDGGMMGRHTDRSNTGNSRAHERDDYCLHNILQLVIGRDFYFGACVPPGPVITELGSLYPASPLRMNCVLPSCVLTTLLFSSQDHILIRRFGVLTRTYRLTTCHGSTSDNGSYTVMSSSMASVLTFRIFST